MKRSLLPYAAVLAALSVVPAVSIAQIVAAATGDARDLAALTAEVAQLTAQSQQLEGEAATLGPRRDELRARARQQARALYHLTQGTAFAAQGGPEMLLDHAARAERVRRIFRRTLRELDHSGRRAEALDADRARVARSLDAARAQKSQIEVQQRAMVAAAPAPTAGPSVTVYGGAPSAALLTDGFGASAGRLLFPVPGRAEARRAWREGADGPGVEIRCAAGTAVRAVYPGRVAFADRYGAYGEIVIVDHGDHYYTVSAGLGRVLVSVGQELPQGAPLGVVGDDGHGPSVFFEVRRGNETVDPVPWLGL
jgi:septal ring factor EnvC (AmiA/AmiB activator)